MFATSHINFFQQKLKETKMLYDSKGNVISVPKGKELSEFALRQLRETKEPLSHKGDPFFKLDQRASFK